MADLLQAVDELEEWLEVGRESYDGKEGLKEKAGGEGREADVVRLDGGGRVREEDKVSQGGKETVGVRVCICYSIR